MTKILSDWGIGEALERVSTPIHQMTFLDGQTGEELGLIAVSKIQEALPADFNAVQYGELFRIFYRLARDAGVELHFDTKVYSVDPWGATELMGPRVSCVLSSSGHLLHLRIATIGLRFVWSYLWTSLGKIQNWQALLDPKCWTGWFGDGLFDARCPHWTGIRLRLLSGHEYTIHSHDVWDEFPMSFESLRIDLFEPRVRKLLKLADQIKKTVFNHYEPFDNWVHESGKVVLVGEAAHPIIVS
ncbi:hypothetical protein JVU11DRAFT_8564 [Chiua virens]|nr:hypothetical protein JVU11DRAFT_8564 [Chiua virens]